MAFGIYVHIPYCLQLCSYCDFTKYEWGKTVSPERYVELLKTEIRQGITRVPSQEIDTIYFGGGTPSLFEPSLILAVLDELAKAGLRRKPTTEITIEIDPATVGETKLNAYFEMGINRFSVGAQTFNDRMLKLAGRKHSAKDTIELLSLLKRYGANYSFDLLFALPTQTLNELRADLATALVFSPAHLSAYCLTIPEGHKLSAGRAPEDEQIEMFDAIETTLKKANIQRYEISNFAQPGFESRHNLLYWTDQPYWGLGLSSHSYFPGDGLWGTRFWNPRAMKRYADELDGPTPRAVEREDLMLNQSITDFAHTALRLETGLSRNALRLKYENPVLEEIERRCNDLVRSGHLESLSEGWTMTSQGRLVANLVFEKLTFLEDDLAAAARAKTF